MTAANLLEAPGRDTPAGHGSEPLAWQAHPARERPGAATAAVAVIAALSAACWTTSGAAWGALAAVVLVAALNRFFFPSRFAIDADGVTAGYLFGRRRYAWRQVRRMHHDRHGVYLSTRRRLSRLDAFRGLHLLYGRASRDEVLRRIRAAMAAMAEQEPQETRQEAGRQPPDQPECDRPECDRRECGPQPSTAATCEPRKHQPPGGSPCGG